MTNWEIFNALLKENNCEIGYQTDDYHSIPFIYRSSDKKSRMDYNNINLHSRYVGMEEEFGTLENYVKLQSICDFKRFYKETIEYIEQMKEAEEWRKNLLAKYQSQKTEDNKTDDKICNITLNLTYSQYKNGGSKWTKMKL